MIIKGPEVEMETPFSDRERKMKLGRALQVEGERAAGQVWFTLVHIQNKASYESHQARVDDDIGESWQPMSRL
jgi:hypothetical protein